MKQITLLLICWCALGCSKAKEPTLTNYEKVLPTASIVEKDTALATDFGKELAPEGDCVFDTSTYKFTTEALRKYDKNIPFFWDKQTAVAQVKLNSTDSLLLHIGGCNHFTFTATYITDSAKFTNTDFLVKKAKWLAKSFFSQGFDIKYVYSIDNKLYKLEEPSRKDFKWYTIIDTDTSITDHTYHGWTVEKVGAKTRLEISGYVN
ncbi:hypothetical protein [Sabulibacter ruber]|uniref:hypothetical protein n=1 Tax=Sabulibacter ruber TaxID=2811901 RepID=UPI001A96A130|nr:hypothetical protein [Sabulibacter ruber]